MRRPWPTGGLLRQKKAKYSPALKEGLVRFSENLPDVIRARLVSSFDNYSPLKGIFWPIMYRRNTVYEVTKSIDTGQTF